MLFASVFDSVDVAGYRLDHHVVEDRADVIEDGGLAGGVAFASSIEHAWSAARNGTLL